MLQCGRRGYYRALPLPFYAPPHQQSSEIGTSIAVCQNLHTRCVTRILLRWGCLIISHELIAFKGHLPLISSALWTSLLLFWRRILLWDRRFWWPASYHISKMLSVIFLLLLLLSTITWCFGQRACSPPCRHASRLPDPDFASSPAGSTRGSTPPTPLSHPPPCPHHHHDIDIDIDIDVDIAGMLLIRGPKIPFTYR